MEVIKKTLISQVPEENQESGSSNEKPEKKRGRKPANKSQDYEHLAMQIQGLHAGLAIVFKNEKLLISKSESEALSKALQNVAKEYDLSIDPKTQAVIGLIATAGIIYIPKFVNLEKITGQSESTKEPAPDSNASDKKEIKEVEPSPLNLTDIEDLVTAEYGN